MIEKIDMKYVMKAYLTAPYGERIVINEDGFINVLPKNIIPNRGEKYISIDVVGPGNINEDYFIEGWACKDPDGLYVECASGRKIGDWYDVVDELIENGDLTDIYDFLVKEISKGAEEQKREECEINDRRKEI